MRKLRALTIDEGENNDMRKIARATLKSATNRERDFDDTRRKIIGVVSGSDHKEQLAREVSARVERDERG